MADAYTPNFNLTLPEVGASRDTWGAKWNTNLTELDQFLGMAMPIGAVLDFCGPTAPSGWLIADGRAVSRTTFSALFAVLGTHFGAGDGSTTFALPNLCGRSGVGPGTVIDQNGNTLSLSFAQKLGNLSNQLTQAHLPNYALVTDAQGGHNHGYWTIAGGGHQHTTDTQGWHGHGGATGGDYPGHTHNGVTDTGGAHGHSMLLPNSGIGTAGGGNSVMSSVFGNAWYQTDVQGNHGHNLSTYGPSQSHQHGISGDGNHAHTTTWIGDHSHGINWDGNHQHTIYLGGSSAWFPVMGPALVVTKIIYCGAQAATFAASVSTTVATLDSEDELAEIKAELEQLRALLTYVPQRQRVMRAPSRGPH